MYFYLSVLYFSIFNYFFKFLFIPYLFSKKFWATRMFAEICLVFCKKETSSDNTIDSKSHGLFKAKLLQY